MNRRQKSVYFPPAAGRARRSHRLEAQDIALSRLVHRFESGWERQLNQMVTFVSGLPYEIGNEMSLLTCPTDRYVDCGRRRADRARALGKECLSNSCRPLRAHSADLEVDRIDPGVYLSLSQVAETTQSPESGPTPDDDPVRSCTVQWAPKVLAFFKSR
jgi:hypothetical protein